ncbi:serine/threonine protein kinase [Nitzschia inconspicua]|uniref:Serine/threonine protein kinase n=1 Tax=Nitzschia inconspicua TaxID=303405 RepID=A0A9K3Q0H5_9STRA|nr:serine/threonine protein kinase [Nitzschia inconspicua]KAG7365950.1 serine/threonine protein kinase [Nitzschia inconspicua]
MGNEGSVPQQQGAEDYVDEQLEYQAKAPPSATNPPGVPPLPSQLLSSSTAAVATAGSSSSSAAALLSNGGPPSSSRFQHHNQSQQQSTIHSGGGGSGSGGSGKGRLMGSVFTRRGNAHNQNSTGIERAVVGVESASATNNNNNNNASHHIVPMPGEELTYMSADPSGDYYQHQQQNQHQQTYDGTSIKGINPYDQTPPPPPPPPQPMYMQQQMQQQQQPVTVTPNQQYYQQDHEKGTSTTAHAVNTAAHALGKKSRRAGAGLISSMRNLSLGFGGGGGGGNANTATTTTTTTTTTAAAAGQSPGRANSTAATRQQQQINEWETRWDEDEDDEDEEERRPEDYDDDDEDDDEQEGINQMDDYNTIQHQQQGHAPNQTVFTQPPPPLHPQMRPDMDSGYASAASAAAAQISSPMPTALYSQQQQQQQHQQQQQQGPFVSPQPGMSQTHLPPYAPTPPTQKAHLVTATPELPITAATAVHQRQPQQTTDDDGVEWDTGMQQSSDGQILSEKPNVEQFLPLLRVLGKGSFGKVVLVQKRVGRETGSLFAMKILRKSHLVRRRQIERTRTERKVLSVVNHPFIMKLHYAFQSPDKLYLVLDYCPGGELFFHLSRFRRFPERVARFYSAELLLALGHLHKRGIIYRDLKPENVLLDADGHVKLGDFGLAKAGIRHAYEGATSMCGTPEYMAPEVLAQQGHGFCVDYWGLGMLTYEMMTGLPPWYTTDRAKLFRRLRSAPLDIPSYFSSASASFSSALLERNPRRRLGVTGIRAAMEHEFFKSISWRALYGRRVEAPIRPCEGWSPPETMNDQQQQQPISHQNHQQQQQYSNNDIHPGDLDAATANFDNQFTRMPVESDHPGEADADEDLEELHEDTFVGFTFDDTDRDEVEAAQKALEQQRAEQQQAQQQQQQRQRTHHFQGDGNNGDSQDQHHLD